MGFSLCLGVSLVLREHVGTLPSQVPLASGGRTLGRGDLGAAARPAPSVVCAHSMPPDPPPTMTVRDAPGAELRDAVPV